MTRFLLPILILSCILLAPACGGKSLFDGAGSGREVSITALEGSSLAGLEWEEDGGLLQLKLSDLPEAGIYARIRLPEGQGIVSEQWQGDGGAIHLIAESADGFEFGIVPLEHYAGETVRADLRIGIAAKSPSKAPGGSQNVVDDLRVEELSGGEIRLEWTELNTGDYDFNGLVGIADLTPLGKFFSAVVDIATPGAELLSTYWVDGDRNGQINISDITPIAANFGNSINGYIVRRNGVTVTLAGQPRVFPRSQAEQRPGLPPQYSVTLPGLQSDNWEVVPVDQGLSQGIGSSPSAGVDATLAVEIEGISLLPFHNAPGLSQSSASLSYWSRFVSPGEVMRRIDPIEWPSIATIGATYTQQDGSASLTGAPRDEWLLLQTVFAPTVDLTTGATKSASGKGSSDLWELDPVCLHVPVKLPQSGLSNLRLELLFSKNQSGGFELLIQAIRFGNPGSVIYLASLDYATGELRFDSDGDSALDDETVFMDLHRAGLSPLRLRQLDDENLAAVGSTAGLTVLGSLKSLDLAAGRLVLHSSVHLNGPESEFEGDYTLHFSEAALLREQLIGGAALAPADLRFGDLQENDLLRISYDYLEGSEIEQRNYITELTAERINAPTDSIIAVPDKTLVREGESVRVTVYANRTAYPLRFMNRVRVTFEDGNSYKPGSFNVGAPGGARDAADGIWAIAAAQDLLLPDEEELVGSSLGDGRVGLDFGITPIGMQQYIPHATGALFNFELVVTEDTMLGFQREDGDIKATYYTDSQSTERFWTFDQNAGQPGIEVLAEPLQLSVVNAPEFGSGTEDDPYIANVLTNYALRLVDPLDGDVTDTPLTEFTLIPAAAGSIPPGSNTLNILNSYSGLLEITASYNGIVTGSDNGVFMFIDDTSGFSLMLREALSEGFGGSLTAASLDFTGTSEGLEVSVLVGGASDLKGLFFDLDFNKALYRPISVSESGLMNSAPLITTPFSAISEIAHTGRTSYGQILANPAAASGFTGDGEMVTILFEREAALPGQPGKQPPSVSCAIATFNDSTDLLSWTWRLVGDYNQNGDVDIDDLVPLAIYYGAEAPLSPIEQVIDGDANGRIELSDVQPLGDNFFTAVDSWSVHRGQNIEYPFGGDTVGTVGFGSAQGDPLTERIYFELLIANPQPGEVFWVRPLYSGNPGVPSNATGG